MDKLSDRGNEIHPFLAICYESEALRCLSDLFSEAGKKIVSLDEILDENGDEI